MELEIQKYLRTGGTVADLQEELGIKVKEHTQYPHLILFKYDQIRSPMGHTIVQEARGLILDSSDDWNVAAYPFSKFFNYSEALAPEIDLASAVVYDKLDGSLMTLYFYNGNWEVSTTGIPDASGPISEELPEDTFKTIFWKLWEENNYQLPKDTNCCYMFEMLSPYNRIICQYTNSMLALIGVRHLETLEEMEPEPISSLYNWNSANSYCIKDLHTLMEVTQAMNPLKREGFVVRSIRKHNGNFLRIKVKNPQYVALAFLNGKITEKQMLEIVRKNEYSEFLVYFPRHIPLWKETICKYNAFLSKAEEVYARFKNIPEQREFAKEVLKFPFSGLLFQMRKEKKSPVQLIQNMSTDNLLEWINWHE